MGYNFATNPMEMMSSGPLLYFPSTATELSWAKLSTAWAKISYHRLGCSEFGFHRKKLWEIFIPITFDPNNISSKFRSKNQSFKIPTKHLDSLIVCFFAF